MVCIEDVTSNHMVFLQALVYWLHYLTCSQHKFQGSVHTNVQFLSIWQ